MKSITQIVEDHIHRYQYLAMRQERSEEKSTPSILTISREPGSGGRILAQKLAEKLGFEVFHQEVLHEMAQRAEVSEQLVKTLDEKGLSMAEDWISSLMYHRYLWPDEYLQHLLKVITTIGQHGRAALVGRGANFILPPDSRFSVRIIAPLKVRVQNVSHEFNLPEQEAKRRVMRTESDRKAFIQKYFYADIADPINYDLILNTATVTVEKAVTTIAAAMGCAVACRRSEQTLA
jgi:cytidylate kinase